VRNRRRVVYYAILLLLILGELLGERNYIIIIFLEYDNTPEQSNMLSQREILLSDSINPEKRLQQTGRDVRAENNLLNNLGFNLCVALQSSVIRLVAYFGVREVVKTEVLNGQVEESERTR